MKGKIIQFEIDKESKDMVCLTDFGELWLRTKKVPDGQGFEWFKLELPEKD
jgi:hypothetical protein